MMLSWVCARRREPRTTLHYLDTNGLPIAAGDFRPKPFIYPAHVLDLYFRAQDDIYLTANLFIH